MNLEHKTYFITGTDTGIGKTHVTRAMMRMLKAQGKSVLGLKPLASGANGQLHEDALIYVQENSLDLPYDMVNPYLFHEWAGPNIAAKLHGQHLQSNHIVSRLQPALNQTVDHIFIEGVGGVLAPISDDETVLDLMRAFNVPVILVVGLRLGCMNHALLSMQALVHAGLPLAGWIPNVIDPTMPYLQENIETISHRIGVPDLVYNSSID